MRRKVVDYAALQEPEDFAAALHRLQLAAADACLP
jgi:hypothetical protein